MFEFEFEFELGYIAIPHVEGMLRGENGCCFDWMLYGGCWAATWRTVCEIDSTNLNSSSPRHSGLQKMEDYFWESTAKMGVLDMAGPIFGFWRQMTHHIFNRSTCWMTTMTMSAADAIYGH